MILIQNVSHSSNTSEWFLQLKLHPVFQQRGRSLDLNSILMSPSPQRISFSLQFLGSEIGPHIKLEEAEAGGQPVKENYVVN